MPPKKASPGVTVILIDVGTNMSRKDEKTGKTDFEKAVTAADWIVSRKLFSEDPENFAVMAYNTTETAEIDFEEFKGVTLHSEEFKPACFDHLKFITKELKINEKYSSDLVFFKGLQAGVALLKSVAQKNPSGITLIVLTNGENENMRQEDFDLLEESIREVGCDLMVIGINENPEFPASKIVELVEVVDGRRYSFDNVAHMLSNYQARAKNERKYNKMWDIAPGIRLPVTITLKAEKSTALLKFKNVDVAGNEMVRMEQIHVESDDVKSEDVKSEVVGTSEDVKSSQKVIDGVTFKPVEHVGKVMHGYNFGKSLILMDPEYMQEKYNNHNFNEGQTGGVLKLIQFTKRANILDSYLLDASSKTVLPSVSTSSRLISATCSLIQAMFDLRVAAICRFTFHAKSHVQLVALLPHKDEDTGVLYLRSVRLPYSEDMRTLKFPKFSFDEEEEDGNKPTVAQLSAVDDLINKMQLQEEEISSIVEGSTSDPRLQMQCHFLKSLVLNPKDTPEIHASRTTEIIDKIMAPKRRIESENGEIFERLGREFSLHPVQKTKRQKIQVEAEDLENMISEWKEKKNSKTTETIEDGRKKKKTMTRKEEIEHEMDENASELCTKTIQMIANMCKYQQNGATSGFFQLLVTELRTIRSVSIEKSKCEEFNEILKKIKDDEDFEPFSEYLAEQKSCNPIHTKEVTKSEFTEDEAAEFWEEI